MDYSNKMLSCNRDIPDSVLTHSFPRKLMKAKGPAAAKAVEDKKKGLALFGPKPPTPKMLRVFGGDKGFLEKLKVRNIPYSHFDLLLTTGMYRIISVTVDNVQGNFINTVSGSSWFVIYCTVLWFSFSCSMPLKIIKIENIKLHRFSYVLLLW